MRIQQTELPGLLLLTPQRFGDARGYFEETWNKRGLSAAGLEAEFVQDNHSLSVRAGTLRGLHAQAPPHAQAKLVRCTQGAIYDVAVDVRQGSPGFGRWTAAELTPENGLQLFLPAGFLHGYLTLRPDTQVQYKCTAYYEPAADLAVRWDSLGISWPLAGAPQLSDKDAAAVPFSSFNSPFLYEGEP
ncbi:dTDP-4-dehydrorhamnose 3,5-epimerase [Aestuariivirga sp.]|uniref:dTDP-4-dehydrorhamnose 3,5-epimerase n=1 Tax=Aestuariivirga sp. TaxID=2650926 RepID=UPI003BAB170A